MATTNHPYVFAPTGNCLEYSDDGDNSEEGILGYSLNLQKKSCKQSGIVYKILNKWTNLSNKSAIFWSFMSVLTGVYFSCETLQTSGLINSSSHYPSNTTSFAYNLLFIWLINFFLLTQQKIAEQNITDNILYWLFANIGGIGFALLGEVPFLSNIVITSDWWKNLSIAAWVCIGIVSLMITIIGIIEIRNSWRDRKLNTSLLSILLTGASYSAILAILIIGNAKNIHYHVHHAIFAGVLSMWFIDWKSWLVMLMHAILMGVVVEGINFYGIGELFLFLTKGSVLMDFNISAGILIVFYVMTLLAYVLSLC